MILKSLVSTYRSSSLRVAPSRAKESRIGVCLGNVTPQRFLRLTRRSLAVIYRFVVPRHRVNFIKPYWGRAEFLCGLLYSDGGRSPSRETLVEKFGEKLNIAGAIIPTSSGRTAFELALKVLKKRYPLRRKVIIPTYGCRGTFDPVINSGLIPVFADIDENLTVSVDSVSNHLTEDTLAILVPHLCGCKARIEEIVSEAHAKGVFVIEDVCQALGGRHGGSFLGKCGDMSIFSFGMGKNLMASAGGILTSHIHEEDLWNEAQNLGKEDTALVKRRFRRILWKYFLRLELNIDRYKRSAYTYSEMHPLDAKLILVQLDRLDDILQKRRGNAQKVIEALRRSGLRCALQDAKNHVYTKLSVICADLEECAKLRNGLHKGGIATEPMYEPLHLQNCGAEFSTREGLPYSERIYRNVFSIPVRPNLHERQLRRILKAIGCVADRQPVRAPSIRTAKTEGSSG